LRVFLNGKEMPFVDGGYKYVFVKPYTKHGQEKIKKEHGELFLQIYDNGVQIRTLVTPKEVSTIINRDVAIDTKNNWIYILEADTKYKTNDDGSVEILES
jgi:hypothetical protein